MVSNGKFVAYYRVSTDRQGRSGLGLEAQRAAVANYLNGGNWSIVAEFTEVESGKREDNRPMLAAAFKACRLHRATLVIAKLDRLSRDAHFLLGLQKAGVEFVCVDDPHMTPLTLGIRAVVAQHERELISARTKAALAAAKVNGKKLGGRRIRKSDGQPVLIAHAAQKRGASANRMRALDRAADLAPTIADIQASGARTLAAIADGLNAAGIPTPRGQGKWSPVQVRRTLEALKEAQGPAGVA
jgi:DNA invertase Pin-like site-specific DNA recombinase